MPRNIRSNNVDRFDGFGELYDRSRPAAPQTLVSIVSQYLPQAPLHIADVGCGTGLSSFLWLDRAASLTGIEPNDDMRQVAINKWEAIGRPEQMRWEAGFSHALPFAEQSLDLVTCSQSFHWMDPQPTLAEFARILRTDGVVAIYDCDWPPSFNPALESSYLHLINRAEQLAVALTPEQQHAHKWDKAGHLQQLQQSGLFRFVKEIVFHDWKSYSGEQFVDLALSQGGLQTALKAGSTEIVEAAAAFREAVMEAYQDENRPILFSYRLRLAVK